MLVRIGFVLAITATIGIGALMGLTEILLSTRPRVEAWQHRQYTGTGMFPRNWPGLPR